jgi:hypothetical protein
MSQVRRVTVVSKGSGSARPLTRRLPPDAGNAGAARHLVRGAGNATGAVTGPRTARRPQRIGIPDRVRAITSRWISLVPSKIV